MKRKLSLKKALISLALIAALLMSGALAPAGIAEAGGLSETQRNAIAMLNYITVLTQEINASKNSRLYMEQAYNMLVNNTYPNSVDSRTLSQLTGLLDTMENYRMVDVKRERLQYIYEQNQAQAILATVPNPLVMMSAAWSFRPAMLAAAIAYMRMDSAASYDAYTSEIDLEHLKSGWALDDSEAAVLHDSRKGIFSYMINMVGEYDLPGDLTLTESAVEEFVQWKNDDNVAGRIRFLESNQKTYQSYGGYWLTLAESYYENGDYAKCLEALDAYEAMGVRIFRKDYDLAQILPSAISAADEILDGAVFTAAAAHYAQLLLDNTENDDWALRYFAAQTYVDLYGKTREASYLQQAYDVALDNINSLIGKQRTLNADYIAPVRVKEAPEEATKDEKKQIKAYNDSLKETRERELPPVSEPLLLNCELLFALAEELNLPESARSEIEGILHPNGEPAFLVQPLDAKFWFSAAPEQLSAGQMEVEYDGTALTLPATYVTSQASITVRVREKDSEEETVLTDWKIDKVERASKNDIATFRAVFASEEAKKHAWAPDAEIHIEVAPRANFDLEPYSFAFTTHGTKDEWYDYLKVWEGHKNNWYDYGKVWENSVVFERVQ